MSRATSGHAQVLGLPSLLAALLLLLASLLPALAADRLSEFLPVVDPGEIVPGADGFGQPVGSPPVAPALAGDEVVGFAFLNSDFVDSTGYSGKPIHIVAGLDLEGRVAGVRLVEHHEPIVLIGIAEERVVDAIASLVGSDVAAVAEGREPLPQVDIVSGATVTVLVMGDSVLRSAIAVMRQGRLDEVPPDQTAAPAAAPARTLAPDEGENRGLGDASRRRLGAAALAHGGRGERGVRALGRRGGDRQAREGRARCALRRSLRRPRHHPHRRALAHGGCGLRADAGRSGARRARHRRHGRGGLLLQGLGLRARRHLRPHRADPGRGHAALPRPRPHPPGRSRGRGRARHSPRSASSASRRASASIPPSPGRSSFWCSARRGRSTRRSPPSG